MYKPLVFISALIFAGCHPIEPGSTSPANHSPVIDEKPDTEIGAGINAPDESSDSVDKENPLAPENNQEYEQPNISAPINENNNPPSNDDTQLNSDTNELPTENIDTPEQPAIDAPLLVIENIRISSVYDQQLCLSLNNGQLINADCALAPAWTLLGQHLTLATQPNKCLTATKAAAFASVELSQCDGQNSNQHWQLTDNQLQHKSFALDLVRGSEEVILYPIHGGNNQQWQLLDESQWAAIAEPDMSPDTNTELEPETEASEPSMPPLAENDRQACIAGAQISTLNNDAGVARMGSVFSETLYDPSNKSQGNNSHKPRPLTVEVKLNGQPLADCEVLWQSEHHANGWLFPMSKTTDANGQVQAWWTAGSANQQQAQASLIDTQGTIQQVEFFGQAFGHQTRSNSIHINWQSANWDHFSVDVTPLTLPATTYYSAINFPGGYTGLQTHKYLFSVWDVNGIDAQIIDPGIATCEGFGGEGTGAKCYVDYSPQINSPYRFEILVSYPVTGRTDYTLYFTDFDNGQRIKVAQLRYGQQVNPSGAAGFVEDWWQTGQSCLDTEERSAYFHNVRAKKGDDPWQEIRSARGSAVYNQWHNEICANYQFSAQDGKFLWSSGGRERVGAPLNLPNSEQPVVDL